MHSYRLVLMFAALFATASCQDAAPDGGSAPANAVVDDFGDTTFAAAAQRVVSLSPATTEIIFALGAGSRLVGRSHWDTFPDSARLVPDLGDGMRPNIEVVIAARPDLVVLYASGENRAARNALRRAGIPTYSRRIDRIADFRRALEDLGLLLGDTTRAAMVRDTVFASLERARVLAVQGPRLSAVWPLWSSPLLVAGGSSFLTELLDLVNTENLFGDIDAPSPQVSFEEVVRRDPDVVLAGPVQVRELQSDARWRTLRAVREGRIAVYDTMLVGRPGVRLGEAALHLARLLR